MSENVTNTAATATDQATAPTIEIAAHAGTCYGLQRALDMALSAAPQAGECTQVHTLGPLIHNPIVVRELAEAGVGLAETLDNAATGTVIIRAHGVVPQAIDAARERGLNVVDATCPYVKKVHVAAERLVREGYRVLVVGEPGHPEVEGILGHAGNDAHVVSCAADANALSLQGKVGLVVQTTQTAQNLAEVVAAITPRVQELRVINTICAATTQGTKQLMRVIAGRLCELPPVTVYEPEYDKPLAEAGEADALSIEHMDDLWVVSGKWLQKLLNDINFDDYESRMYFDRQLRKSGLFDRLEEQGIEDGDTVSIYDFEFDYTK